MIIKKIEQSIGVVGKVLNEKTESSKDTYSCNYINNTNKYATEEVKVGTWLGKSLYRKTLVSNLTSGDNQITHNISNIDKIFINDKSYIYTKNTCFPINYIDTDIDLPKNYIKTCATSSKIYIYVGSNIFSGESNCAITVEYTKITDEVSV